MRFVFTGRFLLLFAFGLLPLSVSWQYPFLRYAVLGYDLILILTAVLDHILSRRSHELTVARSFARRFAIGDPNDVTLFVRNEGTRRRDVWVKDEFPPQMDLEGIREASFPVEAGTEASFTYTVTPPARGRYGFGKTAVRFRSRLGLAWCQVALGAEEEVKVYPNMRRAREIELKAVGANSYLAIRRRAARRGEGREFESMRDYVRGDELRHISWTTTARRAKLTTRQYQIERDQTIIIAIDAGRLMTGRIGDETKFDTAIHAALALVSAASRGGDNCGIAVFGRRIKRYLPPKKSIGHIDAMLESLHDLEPELIEPSYSNAFGFIAANSKKRSFVVILTDLVDRVSSAELINSLKLLRPTHLPLVVTIGDRDLNSTVSSVPSDIKDVFVQSAAEEIIHHRDSALRQVETFGGLALDVTTRNLAPELLQTYLKVKERGMI